MKLGVVGLPNVGKSTLFNAITQAGAQAANYPFCTIEPNVGVVAVPDPRLEVLQKIVGSEKCVPAMLEFVDIAGLVRGASRGEGLGNKFLAHIREVDAIVHVVRCFGGDTVHVEGSIDAQRDIETINIELIFADLETVEKRLERTRKNAKSADPKVLKEVALLEQLHAHLEAGKPVRTLTFDAQDQDFVQSLFLLTSKKVLYAANIGEDDVGRPHQEIAQVQAVERVAAEEGAGVLVICAQLEEEISQLPQEEKQAFLQDMGIGSSGLDRLIAAGYELLGLISYITAGPKEVHAWTIERGTRAPQAAGKIHTDFERGFIRAEVVAYHDLLECGSVSAARDKGLYRSEGKDYVMQDGDVTLFRFNV